MQSIRALSLPAELVRRPFQPPYLNLQSYLDD